MSRPKLTVKKRNILGKKVKKLRRKNILPVNLYGKGIKSCTLKVQLEDFQKVFSQAGETGLVDLEFDNGKIYPALIHDVSYDPLTETPLHVDFYQVDLTKEVTAPIPIVLSGEPEVVKKGEGFLLTLLDEIEVKGLPGNLPSEIVVDVSSLSEIDEAILVKDLKLPQGIRTPIEDEELVCKIEEPRIKEEKMAVEEEVAAEKEEEKEDQKELPKES